jgi:hypothetical protein
VRALLTFIALAVAAMLLWPSGVNAYVVAPHDYGTVSKTEDGIRADVGDRPGGVAVRARLDPAKTYRLVVGAAALDGNFTLRLSRDGALEYRPAPGGYDVTRVSGVTELEALFYSDSPGSYLLRDIQIVECGRLCRGDTELRNALMRGTRGLERALQEGRTADAAALVLDWAAPRIPMASGATAPYDTSRKTAGEIYYEAFAPHRAGVYCGGAADFFKKLLTLVGIPAFTVDFGEAGGLTHVTVVVPDKTRRFFVLDPTFSMTIRVRDGGEQLDLAGALARGASSVRARFGDLTARTVIDDPTATGAGQVARCSADRWEWTACSWISFASQHQLPLATARSSATGAAFLPWLVSSEIFAPRAHDVPDDFLQLVDELDPRRAAQRSGGSSAVSRGTISAETASQESPATDARRAERLRSSSLSGASAPTTASAKPSGSADNEATPS